MHFQRLRLSGFKSFVEATEFRIEPGLTGVVGPNGCGKSNLLEALRWVMGATSAKAMRGEGMDDVIFGGASNRPSRNHAEVLLQIDNADRTAPAQFNDHPILEVTRRIDRGQGSTYRVNGVETRARDVQLLFADASTGANSPSLVRQGQISELIAAKPSNRRRILEEAAGVSGLHSRRHEADLRLRAAEANLARLDDVMGELDSSLGKLKREARQAEKYKRLAAEIRALQGAMLYARWRDADEALKVAAEAKRAAEGAVEAAAREAANATTTAANSAEAMKPLREEEAVAAAVLQRLIIERDRIEREEAQAQAEVDRLKADRTRIAADHAREQQVADDAASTLSRLTRELKDLEAAIASAPERVPELDAALQKPLKPPALLRTARSSASPPKPRPTPPVDSPRPRLWSRPKPAAAPPARGWTSTRAASTAHARPCNGPRRNAPPWRPPIRTGPPPTKRLRRLKARWPPPEPPWTPPTPTAPKPSALNQGPATQPARPRTPSASAAPRWKV